MFSVILDLEMFGHFIYFSYKLLGTWVLKIYSVKISQDDSSVGSVRLH